MKPPPAWLPSASSRKWHNRRWWDSLGYLRVRSLANPNWHRDLDLIARHLRSARPSEAGEGRDLIDDAIRLVQEHKGLGSQAGEPPEHFERRVEEHWDRLLTAIDMFLELRQEEHLRGVDEAGKSGRS